MSWKMHLFYLSMIAVLLFALLAQGRYLQRISTERSQEVAPKELYAQLRSVPGSYQVVDTRSLEDFEEGHPPGAVSLADGILKDDAPMDRYKKTIIVSEDGDPKVFQALSREFKVARNLAGGMDGWIMARLPEESGLVDTSAMAQGPAG